MKPLATALLCVAPALALAFVPTAADSLLYNRDAILGGEWWRLFTGHWVHFSLSHLAWNCVVLFGAGIWLERVQPGRLLRYLAIAAPLLSLAFLAIEPAMRVYGGLSGLATGVVVLLALTQLSRNPGDRPRWIALLVLVLLKLGLEAIRPTALFADFGATAVRASTLAHLAGAISALIFFLSPDLLCARSERPAGNHSS